MRRSIRLVLSMLLLGTLLSAVPARATEERTYVAGIGDLTAQNCAGTTAPDAPALGGGCFDIPAGTGFAHLSVEDAHGRPVATQVTFRDALATIEGTGATVCGNRTIPVPQGAVRMTVYISTAFAPLDCGLTATPGSTGTIRVEWVAGPQQALPNETTGRGSMNISPVANVAYPAVAGWPWPGGTDLEFFTQNGRRYALTGSYQNGMRIIDVTDPATPVVTATYDCKIYQADIQIFERDGRRYVIYSVDDYSNTNVDSDCFRDAGWTEGVRYGSFIVDITDPSAPKAISFAPLATGSHNTTVAPGGRYLYSSNADLLATDGIIELFDLADLTKPTLIRRVALGVTLPSHDITFSEDGTRAYVAAITSTVILDTTNLADPKVIGTIIDPSINIHHQSDPITIDDPLLGERTFLLITDEIAGAEGNGLCPGGGIHVYDVTDPAIPLPVGFFDLPDTRTVTHRLRCTAHVMRLYPDQKIATIAWYASGVRVLDLSGLAGLSVGTEATGSVGAGIKQIGWYAFDRTDVWSVKAPADAFESDGSFYMFGNDQLRGFDVYRFDGSAPRSTDIGRWLTEAPAPAFSFEGGPVAKLLCVLKPTS